ncbi:MAG: hypothetical protein B6247_08895 [Candidatus Parabeggiatoa sp. nov. 2]|nr:MAG: hypothetical protein B6247_08895 [Beggiatoa sp. 4572_84]
MEENSPETFPKGLPDNLLLPKEESDVIHLFTVLQMPREIRKAFVGRLPKTQKKKKRNDRETLIFFYSEPDNRFELFESFLQSQHEDIDNSASSRFVGLLGKSHKSHKVANQQVKIHFAIPSLEYNILSDYSPDFLEASYQEDKLASCITAWEEVGQTIESVDDNLKKSLMLWLKAQEDLEKWSALTAEQQIKLANVVFALATIAKSYSLILQAIEQVPELARYYSQLFSNIADSSTEQAKEKLMATDSLSLEQQWKTLCSEIIATAQQALEKPSIEFIEAFQAFSAQLEGLREQIPVKEQALEDINGQLEKLEGYLLKLSQQESFDLQHLDNLLSRWYLSAYQPDTVKDINRVTQDIDRVFVEVAPLAEEDQGLSQQFRQLTTKLPSLSLKEQQASFAQITAIHDQRVKIGQEILNQASPFQEAFDNDKDSLTEWLKLSSELRQPARETPPVLVDTSADEKTQSDDSSASEASKVGHSTESDDLKNTPAIEKSDASKVGHSTESDETEPHKTEEKLATPVESSPPLNQSLPTAATVETPPSIAEPSTVQPEKTAIVEEIQRQLTAKKFLAAHSLSREEPQEIQEIARSVATSQPNTTEHLELLNALVWRLIDGDRIGLCCASDYAESLGTESLSTLFFDRSDCRITIIHSSNHFFLSKESDRPT